MATPFESFIQTELPKRPYLAADITVEDVVVRRGAGPLQLGGVTLENGQVLGKVGGQMVGINQTAMDFLAPVFAEPELTWVINHGKNNKNANVLLRDLDDNEITADNIHFGANTITVTFAVPQAGTPIIIFVG